MNFIQTGRISRSTADEKATGRTYFRHLILASTAFAAVALMAPDANAAACNIGPVVTTSGLPGSGTCTFKGGTLKVNGGGSTSDTFSLGTGGGTIDQNALSYTFSGAITGAAGNAITFANSGSAGVGGITLSASDGYNGSTTINTGAVLLLSGSGSIASSASVTNNGTLNISGTTSGTTINALTGSGTVLLGAQPLTVNNGASVVSIFSGTIGGTGGALALSGAGTETLQGVNTYTGATSIGNTSTLALYGSGSIAASSGVADLNVFDISGVNVGGNTASIASLSSTGAHSGTVNLGGNTLVLTNASGNFHGAINGAGGLTVNGGTGETLSGANTYSGLTTIGLSGTLSFAAGGSSVNSTVIDNGALSLNGQTFVSLTVANTAAAIGIGVSTITLSNASGTIGGQLGVGAAGSLVIQSGAETIAKGGSFYDTGGITLGTNTPSSAEMVLDGISRSSITVLDGSQLSGTGSIAATGTVRAPVPHNLDNSGTVAPGDAILTSVSGAANTNALTVQGAFTNEGIGTFQINVDAITVPVGSAIAGDAYGTYGNLSVTGLATLGGTFDLEGMNLFDLANGETTLYDVLSFGSFTGDFSGLMYNGDACTAESADLYACGAHITIAEDFTTNAGQLNLDITVPEPSSLAMLGSALVGLLGFGFLRRRRA